MEDMKKQLMKSVVGDDEREVDELLHALSSIANEAEERLELTGCKDDSTWACFLMPDVVVSPRNAFFGIGRTVPLEQAENKICSEIITIYPPGIPILCPGERVSKEIILQCLECKKAGLNISGAADISLETIQVVDY